MPEGNFIRGGGRRASDATGNTFRQTFQRDFPDKMKTIIIHQETPHKMCV